MLNPTCGRSNHSPFTATQWQELEHQALIFKYMVSGVPVPPELLYPVRRSLETSLSSRLFPQQPIGWGCFQLEFGRKADPEPGRCRRTDGKKWRCSKEAYQDSKYCEKHMHRGRNRSRKPVELTSTAVPPATTSHSQSIINPNSNVTTITPSPSTSSCFSQLSPSVEPEVHSHQSSSSCNILNPSFHPHSSSSRTSGFSSQNGSPYSLFMESGSSRFAKDHSYFLGAREAVDQSALLSEATEGGRSSQHSLHQLPMSCYEKGDSTSQFQGFPDDNSKQQQSHHCFVLGTDIKSSASNPLKWEKAADSEKPLHQFFGEWSPKDADT